MRNLGADSTLDKSQQPKGLLGFYVAACLALVLFAGVWSAWTPLKIWYWKREIQVAMLAASAWLGGSPWERPSTAEAKRDFR
jgi:hypothetical protein